MRDRLCFDCPNCGELARFVPNEGLTQHPLLGTGQRDRTRVAGRYYCRGCGWTGGGTVPAVEVIPD